MVGWKKIVFACLKRSRDSNSCCSAFSPVLRLQVGGRESESERPCHRYNVAICFSNELENFAMSKYHFP